MPFKDKTAYREYHRNYMRVKRRECFVQPDLCNPVQPDISSTPLPRPPKLYQPDVHYRPGERVLIKRGRQLIEVEVPELDADGQPMW